MRAIAYSHCVAAAVRGMVQRGVVHSAFTAAANVLFPSGFILSLNAVHGPRMPNGLQLSAGQDGAFFAQLRPSMPVLLGAERLVIEAVHCSLDLSMCEEWHPHIERPEGLDVEMVRRNGRWLVDYLVASRPHPWPPQGGSLHVILPFPNETTCSGPPCGGQGWGVPYFPNIPTMAQYLSGRGAGLTPAGDDMLLGWMAMNWLLHGPTSEVRKACQQIMLVAHRQTHLLSQCWLGYAAEGDVALPIKGLLEAMTREDDELLERAVQEVLAIGATSGYDVVQGILLGLEQFRFT